MSTYRKLFHAGIVALAMASMAAAQEQSEENKKKPARRLETITWSPVDHKLTWTVSAGKVGGGGTFDGDRKLTYVIDMDDATMTVEGDDRRFSKAEAVSVHRLMDLISKYAAESTVWWEAGEGEKVNRDGGSRVDDRKKDEHSRPETLIPETPRESEKERRKVIRISEQKVE